MAETEETTGAKPDGDADASLIEGLRDLIDDGQTLVQAELAYQQARIVYAWGRSKGIAALLLLAIGFGFFTLLAMVVGLLLALAPLLTAWGALGAVTVGLALLSAACFGVAVSRFRRARGVLLSQEDKP